MKHPVLAGSLAATVASALLVVLAPVGVAQVDLNCVDFPWQEIAQEEFNRDSSDPHDLDADNDGVACEELPRSGSAPGVPAPARGRPRVTG
jgi:hypothetical protein